MCRWIDCTAERVTEYTGDQEKEDRWLRYQSLGTTRLGGHMEVKRVIEIVTALANGVDPYAGEVLDKGPFQNADTTRALYLALKGLGMLDRRI